MQFLGTPKNQHDVYRQLLVCTTDFGCQEINANYEEKDCNPDNQQKYNDAFESKEYFLGQASLTDADVKTIIKTSLNWYSPFKDTLYGLCQQVERLTQARKYEASHHPIKILLRKFRRVSDHKDTIEFNIGLHTILGLKFQKWSDATSRRLIEKT